MEIPVFHPSEVAVAAPKYEAEKVLQAIQEGENAARAQIQRGATFLSAYKSADLAGYVCETPYRRSFIMAYLTQLPSTGIKTVSGQRIIGVGLINLGVSQGVIVA